MNRTLTRALGAIALGTLLLQPVTTMADPPAHARNEKSVKHRGQDRYGGFQARGGDYDRDGRHDDRYDGRRYGDDRHYHDRYRYDDDHRHSGGYWYPRRGHVVHHLPPHARVVHHYGYPYYYAGGTWYQPYGAGFMVVAPPVGLAFTFAPDFHASFFFGGIPYYQAGPVYYARHPKKHGYVVVNGPY